MNKEECIGFLLTFVITVLLIPVVNKVAHHFGIYAQENNRTVHHGKIARIGGVAFFIAFILVMAFYVKIRIKYWWVIIAAACVFVEGLIDDIKDIKPIMKIVAQVACAVIMIFGAGVYFEIINLFGWQITNKVFCMGISFLWYVGVVNAINLIDGLDGLSSGFGIIVLFSIALITNYPLVKPVCFSLAGGLLGFFIFNYHPGSIFMGDCGAQFLGAMLASLTILGFKSKTTIAWACPVMLLCVPIMDTLLAIVRRKVNHQSITSPDKSHLHHVLMNKMNLGQKGSVLVIHFYTMLMGFNAYLYIKSRAAGLGMFAVLYVSFLLFVEKMEMISPDFHPLLSLIRNIKEKKNKAE